MKAIYKRGKNLKEILSPSSSPSTKNLILGLISNCNKRCDIYTDFIVFDNTFKRTATGKYHKVKVTLSCNSVNVVYLITCQCCKLQYVGSVITFTERFHVHKSDINTRKKGCGATKHFLECCSSEGISENLKIQPIKSVNIPDKIWQCEKYCQVQLLYISHGLNSPSDWYYINRKGYTKYLSMYFPNRNFRLLDFDYYRKYQCKTFYFTICRAMKEDTLLSESLLE